MFVSFAACFMWSMAHSCWSCCICVCKKILCDVSHLQHFVNCIFTAFAACFDAFGWQWRQWQQWQQFIHFHEFFCCEHKTVFGAFMLWMSESHRINFLLALKSRFTAVNIVVFMCAMNLCCMCCNFHCKMCVFVQLMSCLMLWLVHMCCQCCFLCHMNFICTANACDVFGSCLVQMICSVFHAVNNASMQCCISFALHVWNVQNCF